MELTATEVRLIEENRAAAAIATRPVDKRKAIGALMKAVRLLAEIGVELDPHDGMWQSLLESFPGD